MIDDPAFKLVPTLFRFKLCCGREGQHAVPCRQNKRNISPDGCLSLTDEQIFSLFWGPGVP